MAIGEVVKLTRRQLYDEVWSAAMLQLSKKYSLSGVGMAKICDKYEIPRPPRGYWAKKQVGLRRLPDRLFQTTITVELDGV